MRGATWRRLAVTFFGTTALIVILAGCRTSTRSGLPSHIKTVEIHIFQNKTMYKGIEAQVTRSVIDRVNMDPVIRVSSRNGDALITGEITDVQRSTLRETTNNEPATVRITITATYSLYDQVERRYIVEDAEVSSTATGQLYGVYERGRGENAQTGEESAARALAAEIVRRTVAMW